MFQGVPGERSVPGGVFQGRKGGSRRRVRGRGGGGGKGFTGAHLGPLDLNQVDLGQWGLFSATLSDKHGLCLPWGFSRPSNQTSPAEGRRCLAGRPAEGPKVGVWGVWFRVLPLRGVVATGVRAAPMKWLGGLPHPVRSWYTHPYRPRLFSFRV